MDKVEVSGGKGLLGFKRLSARSVFNFLLTILLAVCFRAFVYEPFNVPSGSMKSTLLEGDYVFVEKFAYGYSRYSLPFNVNLINGRIFKRQPERGDIVVFVPERMQSVYFIKRVIGLPGDTVQVREGVLYLNGKATSRRAVGSYVNENNGKSLNKFVETLDNGRSYDVLMDPYSGSLYSDNTPKYVVPTGKYFMMGDNRNNSHDSRYLLDIGYVGEEYIVGRASTVAFSLSPYAKWYKALRGDRFFHSLKSNVESGGKPSAELGGKGHVT